MNRLIFGDTDGNVQINRPLSLFSTIFLSVIGASVFIVQPGFVQGLVRYYHFSEQGAGYIASVEVWGIAATTIVMALLAHRYSWRHIIGVSIALILFGNLTSIFTSDIVGFGVCRFLAGVGSGGLVSLTFTIVGLTRKPDRNFGLLIMAVLTFGALGLLVLPTAFALIGMRGVLVFFALFALAGLPLIRYLPVSGDSHVAVEADAVELPLHSRLMAVATMLLYFTGQGAVWAYLFLIGTNGGSTEQQVANGLTLSQFIGIGGAFTAAFVGIRFGRLKPVTIGILAGIIPLFFLFGKTGAVAYATIVCVYNYAWNMTHPFLLAALASFDRKGTVVTHGVAAQMVGLAIGPAVAAYFISPGDYDNVIWLGTGFFTLALILIVPPILEQRRRVREIAQPGFHDVQEGANR